MEAVESVRSEASSSSRNMSYAIETKKRKFERILETLTDSTSAPSRTPLDSVRVTSTPSISTASTSDSSKRRRIANNPTFPHSQALTSSLTTHYLPSSRPAFLQRLETFRNVTRWHVPSTSTINAAEWAKRGWLCQGSDTVCCPSCRESVHVDLEPRDTITTNDTNEEEEQNAEDDALSMQDAVYEGLINRYQNMIVSAHSDDCPWRRRGCDSSIQRIEGLLNSTNVLSLLRMRYSDILKTTDEIPPVAELLSTKFYSINEQELEKFEMPEHQSPHTNILKLAICGWQAKEADVVECRYCFRSLGLWLYRGDSPTMDQLDPIDSHLEYCPWRSPDAQDAEIMVTRVDVAGKDQAKERMPGWLLAYQAIVKDNAKKATQQSRKKTSSTEVSDNILDQVELTPEQRDKKMKDLRQRIRDLKKPFNFKALLRRKDKSAV